MSASLEGLEKEPAPPVQDDRSRKKDKFREEDGTSVPPMSFKDSLMKDTVVNENNIFEEEDDEIVFDDEDIRIFTEDNMPAVVLSQKVKDYFRVHGEVRSLSNCWEGI